MKHTTGTYIKAYGADWGAYFDGKNWIGFQCVGCEHARGNLGQKISQFDVRVKIGKWGPDHKHDKSLHNHWLQSGKPVNR